MKALIRLACPGKAPRIPSSGRKVQSLLSILPDSTGVASTGGQMKRLLLCHLERLGVGT